MLLHEEEEDEELTPCDIFIRIKLLLHVLPTLMSQIEIETESKN